VFLIRNRQSMKYNHKRWWTLCMYINARIKYIYIYVLDCKMIKGFERSFFVVCRIYTVWWYNITTNKFDKLNKKKMATAVRLCKTCMNIVYSRFRPSSFTVQESCGEPFLSTCTTTLRSRGGVTLFASGVVAAFTNYKLFGRHSMHGLNGM